MVDEHEIVNIGLFPKGNFVHLGIRVRMRITCNLMPPIMRAVKNRTDRCCKSVQA